MWQAEDTKLRIFVYFSYIRISSEGTNESFKALNTEELERAYPLNICITSLNFQTILNDKLWSWSNVHLTRT